MALFLVLYGIAALLAAGVLGIAIARPPFARGFVYATSLIISLITLCVAVSVLLGIAASSSLRLPLGLPWIGANFAIDPLSAFFLAVVALGSAAASLFALGYGRHEEAPERVLPAYPLFLAAMQLV